jgi:UPF0755 protein
MRNLEDFFNELKTCSQVLNNNHLSKIVSKTIESQQYKNAKLLILGSSNSGRASLCNTIIGKNILPTSPLPKTELSLRLSYSNQEFFELIYKNNIKKLISKDELKKYMISSKSDSLEIDSITLGIDSNALKNYKIFIKYIAIILIICMAYTIYTFANLDKNKSAEINIQKGDTTSKIADKLKEKGIIRSKFVYELLSRYYKFDSKYKTGLYKVKSDLGYKGIMERLSNQKNDIGYSIVTIPEGYTVKQIAEKLSQKGIVNKQKFIDVTNKVYKYPFLDEKNIKSNIKLEGYLFPDTYYIRKGMSEEKIVKMMLERFNTVFKKKYYDRAKNLNMSINKVITMASIVEREAEVEEERPIIAGVFYNRLNRKIKLQSCATVQYLLPFQKKVLTLKDISINSPYNTYKIQGLPIGPICSPGIKSIEAALYPNRTDYLYFVAKGNGKHEFSKTYSEHLKSVKIYEK